MYYDTITQNFSKLVFNLMIMIIHYLLHAAWILWFAYVDSHKGDIKRNNNVHDNLWVLIKKKVQSEILSCGYADVVLPFC